MHDERVCTKRTHEAEKKKQICDSKGTERHCSVYCQNGEHMVNTLHINECINYNNTAYIISSLKKSSKQKDETSSVLVQECYYLYKLSNIFEPLSVKFIRWISSVHIYFMNITHKYSIFGPLFKCVLYILAIYQTPRAFFLVLYCPPKEHIKSKLS